MKETVILLFSDHIWFACYENQIGEFISTHKWNIKNGRYVLVYHGQNYRKIILDK